MTERDHHQQRYGKREYKAEGEGNCAR